MIACLQQAEEGERHQLHKQHPEQGGAERGRHEWKLVGRGGGRWTRVAEHALDHALYG